MKDNYGAILFGRLGEVLAANPWFWIFFLGFFVLVTIAGLEGFRRRWLRALVASLLALECAVFLSGSWLL